MVAPLVRGRRNKMATMVLLATGWWWCSWWWSSDETPKASLKNNLKSIRFRCHSFFYKLSSRSNLHTMGFDDLAAARNIWLTLILVRLRPIGTVSFAVAALMECWSLDHLRAHNRRLYAETFLDGVVVVELLLLVVWRWALTVSQRINRMSGLDFCFLDLLKVTHKRLNGKDPSLFIRGKLVRKTSRPWHIQFGC